MTCWVNLRALLRRKMKSVLKALAICGAGGVLFSVLRAPLPWMLGLCLPWPLENSWAPISLAQRGPSDRTAHHRLRAWLVLHTVVGHEVAVHWYLLIAAAVFALLLAYASGWFLTRSTGLDGTTALFASVPEEPRR